jgi:hypothetical protein
MNDYCVIARKCKIPDPSLRLIDSTRFTLSQARRVVLGSATLAYRWYRNPTTIRQCVAGLRLDSDRFALPGERLGLRAVHPTERWRHC